MKISAIVASAVSLMPAFAAAAIDTSPFKMVAVSSNSSVNGATLKANDHYFYLNRPTNSSCGDVAPMLNMDTVNGTVAMYRSPTANYSQTAYIAISGAEDGLFAYSWSDYFSKNTGEYAYLNQFSRVNNTLLYEGRGWLACQGEGKEFCVYSEREYGKPEIYKKQCVPFQIQTVPVKNATSCKYFP